MQTSEEDNKKPTKKYTRKVCKRQRNVTRNQPKNIQEKSVNIRGK